MNEAISRGYNDNEQYAKLPSLSGTSPQELAEALRDILDQKKGRDIRVLFVADNTPIADYFVLCTGTSTTQIKGLTDELEYRTGLRGLPPLVIEGRGNGSWVLLDFGSVIVHIFSQQAREFYNLDKLYGPAEAENITETDTKAEETK
jgi:ribosome-associated protein